MKKLYFLIASICTIFSMIHTFLNIWTNHYGDKGIVEESEDLFDLASIPLIIKIKLFSPTFNEHLREAGYDYPWEFFAGVSTKRMGSRKFIGWHGKNNTFSPDGKFK